MNIDKRVFHILLVEDEALDARLVTRLLNPPGVETVEGYQFCVDRAPTLDEALQTLSQKEFDLVLLDLGLPDGVGTESVEIISKTKPGLPIVVLTGNDDTATALDAVQKGAQDYFMKQALAQHALIRCLLYAVERQSLNDQLKLKIAQLEQYAEKLEASNVELQQFAYVASHDLQTPLRSITGFLQLLKQDYHGRLTDEADDWIQRSVLAANRLHEMINDLLAYSRTQTHGQAFIPVDLNVIAREATVLLETAITETGGRVTMDPLPTVAADRSQMLQLFQNLIGNAIKYHRQEPPHVHLSAKEDSEGWLLSVRDNGIGIDEQHFDLVFEIFRRLHGQNEFSGSGIGLAVCRKIVQRHGGRIWIESELGRGSTFFFTISNLAATEQPNDSSKNRPASADLACRRQ